MSGLKFDGEMARLQQAVAQCHDLIARRTAVFEALRLVPDERVLEFGCGGGFYTREAARFVGSDGAAIAPERGVGAVHPLDGKKKNAVVRFEAGGNGLQLIQHGWAFIPVHGRGAGADIVAA